MIFNRWTIFNRWSIFTRNDTVQFMASFSYELLINCVDPRDKIILQPKSHVSLFTFTGTNHIIIEGYTVQKDLYKQFGRSLHPQLRRLWKSMFSDIASSCRLPEIIIQGTFMTAYSWSPLNWRNHTLDQIQRGSSEPIWFHISLLVFSGRLIIR